MPLGEPRSLPRRLVLRGALGLACGLSTGCESLESSFITESPRIPGAPRTIGSFHIVGEGMYEGFQRWLATVTKEDRTVIDELIARKDLLIHVFLAVDRLPALSRGGISGLGSDMKDFCDFHPIVGKFGPERDWDVVYDRQRADAFQAQHGIPTPVEVILQHEIFGHVLPILRNPKLKRMVAEDPRLKDANECEALEIENRYRKHIGLREVPPELEGCPSP